MVERYLDRDRDFERSVGDEAVTELDKSLDLSVRIARLLARLRTKARWNGSAFRDTTSLSRPVTLLLSSYRNNNSTVMCVAERPNIQIIIAVVGKAGAQFIGMYADINDKII